MFEIGHLTKYDAFRVNRDQVMDLATWLKIHTNVYYSIWSQRPQIDFRWGLVGGRGVSGLVTFGGLASFGSFLLTVHWLARWRQLFEKKVSWKISKERDDIFPPLPCRSERKSKLPTRKERSLNSLHWPLCVFFFRSFLSRHSKSNVRKSNSINLNPWIGFDWVRQFAWIRFPN